MDSSLFVQLIEMFRLSVIPQFMAVLFFVIVINYLFKIITYFLSVILMTVNKKR
jgi:hypothetical protein